VALKLTLILFFSHADVKSRGGRLKISQEILDLVPYKPGKPISETQREAVSLNLQAMRTLWGQVPRLLRPLKKL
jgi:hypothetical protein